MPLARASVVFAVICTVLACAAGVAQARWTVPGRGSVKVRAVTLKAPPTPVVRSTSLLGCLVTTAYQVSWTVPPTPPTVYFIYGSNGRQLAGPFDKATTAQVPTGLLNLGTDSIYLQTCAGSWYVNGPSARCSNR